MAGHFNEVFSADLCPNVRLKEIKTSAYLVEDKVSMFVTRFNLSHEQPIRFIISHRLHDT